MTLPQSAGAAPDGSHHQFEHLQEERRAVTLHSCFFRSASQYVLMDAHALFSISIFFFFLVLFSPSSVILVLVISSRSRDIGRQAGRIFASSLRRVRTDYRPVPVLLIYPSTSLLFDYHSLPRVRVILGMRLIAAASSSRTNFRRTFTITSTTRNLSRSSRNRR